MKDKLQLYTAAWHKRQSVHRHNGMFGSIRMAEVALVNLITLKTTTDETRNLAKKLLPDIRLLYLTLNTRRDQQK